MMTVIIFEKEMLDTETLWQEIFGNLNNAVWNIYIDLSSTDNLYRFKQY